MQFRELLTEYTAEYDLVVDGQTKPFEALQFSRSSMSVYLPIVNENSEIYNHLVVTGEGGVLKWHPLELRKKDGSETIKVSNVSFNDEGEFQRKLPLETLGAAVTAFNINSSLLTLRKVLFNGEPSNLKWVGGNHDYSKNYVVVLRCEHSPLSKKQAMLLLKSIANGTCENLNEMQMMVLQCLQKNPEILKEDWVGAKDLTANIYKSAAIIYLYRASCMVSKTVEFPVMINDTCIIAEEYVHLKAGNAEPSNIF